MQLRNARLCLDCEEIHDAPQCPSCASETFAFITRWVPAPERRAAPRPTEPESPEALDTYRQMLVTDQERRSARWKMVGGSAVGLALFGVAGWMWRRNTRGDGPADRQDNERRSQPAPAAAIPRGPDAAAATATSTRSSAAEFSPPRP